MEIGLVGLGEVRVCHGEPVEPWQTMSPFDELRVTSVF